MTCTCFSVNALVQDGYRIQQKRSFSIPTCCDWMILCRSEAKYLKFCCQLATAFTNEANGKAHGKTRYMSSKLGDDTLETCQKSAATSCKFHQDGSTMPPFATMFVFLFVSLASNVSSHLAHVHFNFSHSNLVPLCIHPQQIVETEPLLENPREKGDSHDVVVRAGESGNPMKLSLFKRESLKFQHMGVSKNNGKTPKSSIKKYGFP